MADFDSVIRNGGSIEEAISIAASENHLKTEVVKVRAEKAFGDLELYKARCMRQVEFKDEERAKMKPLADFIDAIFQRSTPHTLPFIPIGNFVRSNFTEGLARETAFAFSREHQRRWKR